jgi:hypothetical protein
LVFAKSGWYEKLREPPEKEPFFILIYEPKAHSTLCRNPSVFIKNKKENTKTGGGFTLSLPHPH